MKYQNAKSRNPNEKIPPEGRNRKGGLNKRAEIYMGARKSARAIRKDKITETGDKKNSTKDQSGTCETSAKQRHKEGEKQHKQNRKN